MEQFYFKPTPDAHSETEKLRRNDFIMYLLIF